MRRSSSLDQKLSVLLTESIAENPCITSESAFNNLGPNIPMFMTVWKCLTPIGTPSSRASTRAVLTQFLICRPFMSLWHQLTFASLARTRRSSLDNSLMSFMKLYQTSLRSLGEKGSMPSVTCIRDWNA